MIIETHAHYDDEAFDADREELLRELPEKGIGRVINVGASMRTTRNSIALAEKYQAALAAKKDRSYTSYSWNGGYYKKWLAKQDVEINDKIWDRVSVGNITLKHDKVNYVNGQDEKDSDENENRKK